MRESRERLRRRQMHPQKNEKRGDAIPVKIAIVVAVLGIAGILFQDLDLDNGSRGHGNARTITAAAVSRAGAIEIPSGSPAGQPAS
jgi:hypothetical protein